MEAIERLRFLASFSSPSTARQEEGRRENATLQSLPFPPRYIAPTFSQHPTDTVQVGQCIIIPGVPVPDRDDAVVEHGDDDEHDEREAAREGHVQPEPRRGASHAAEPNQ